MNSKAHFRHESPDIPDMVELRETYRLRDVIAEAGSEFEQFLALRAWVQQCWDEHGFDQIPETTNTLKILEAAQQGKLFQCWYYATVFIQCAVALGFKARRLSIGIHPGCSRSGNTGHITAEIWSHDYQKWIVMDADANAHYERDGLPLSGLEIHNSWCSMQLDKITYVQGKPVPKIISKFTPEERATQFVFGAYDIMDYYFKLQVEMRNTWFSSNVGLEPGAMAWVDRFHSDYSARVGQVIDNVYYTDDPDVMWWKE